LKSEQDDCWQAPYRKNGHVVADSNRFPSGIKALADYVHKKGLKLGLYTAMGNNSCAASKFAKDTVGLSCNYDAIPKCDVAKRDLEDFVSWGIDHLKVDGCDGLDTAQMNYSYDIVGRYLLNATNRAVAAGTREGPVAYHPSFLGFSFPRQFRELASIGNQWRFFNDIQASW
jgi:alpha-N-acetylgalactosaminidase